MRILDWLFGAKKTSALMEFMCSSCFEIKPGEQMHALPWWNPHEDAFLMSIRCGDCFPESLTQARDRVRAWDAEAEAAFRSFLDIWKIEARMPELVPLDPPRAAEAVLDYVERTEGRTFAAVFLGLA